MCGEVNEGVCVAEIVVKLFFVDVTNEHHVVVCVGDVVCALPEYLDSVLWQLRCKVNKPLCCVNVWLVHGTDEYQVAGFVVAHLVGECDTVWDMCRWCVDVKHLPHELNVLL